MSENEVVQISEGQQEIPSMLLPMGEYNVLLPTVSVAEMSPVNPLETVADGPDWLMGLYSWRDMKVPVVSLDILNGESAVPMNPKGRFAVLNNTGIDDSVPFIAIHTQGIPRMTRVGEKDIVENTEAENKPFNLMAVKVGVEEFVIPDIAAIEAAFANLDM